MSLLDEFGFKSRVDEFRAGTRKSDIYLVALPWSHYHNLLAAPAARVFTDAQTADKYADDAQDEVIETTSLGDACRAAAAFDIMCACDWTPNQSPGERKESAAGSEDAQRIIEAVRTAVRLAHGEVV